MVIGRRGVLAPALASGWLLACSTGAGGGQKLAPDAGSHDGAADAGRDVAPASDAGPRDAARGDGTGLGPATGLDAGPISAGGTITFQNIGATGSYPSVCAPPAAGSCCRQPLAITSDALTPWDEELIMTLRGPMNVKQLAVYQPGGGGAPDWQLAARWDARAPASSSGVAFTGNATPNSGFEGTVGSVCLVNVSTDKPFGCGPGSSPYCAAGSPNHDWGWSGSKLFVLLASMPHVGATGAAASDACAAASNGWTDAPWIGLSVGELIRAGAFSSCQCYESTPNHGDGCGQLNAFEVINDNDTSGNYKNLDLFSSNFFGYGGDFGGPCGTNTCAIAGLPANVDLVKASGAAAAGGLASQTPRQSPSVFFRRPATGYRYFLLLFDVTSRTVQLAVVHPENVPAALGALLPALPAAISGADIGALLALRLPSG